MLVMNSWTAACGRYLSLLVISVFFVQPAVAAAGFGVSPPTINQQNAVAGSHFSNTVYLVQGNPDHDVEVHATVESRDMKDWVSFENGDTFTIPKGVQQYPFVVNFAVPQNANLGIYKAFIRVTAAPAKKAEESGEVAIALGGRIDVTLTIGDDIVSEFEILGIDILNVASGDPLQASVRINNSGNVDAAPYAASFELFDKFGNTRLAFINATEEQFPKVPAFSTKETTLSFPVDLVVAPGEYWGHVKIYDEHGTVLRELRTVFNVTERRKSANVLAALGAIGSDSYVLIGVVVLIVLLIAGAFGFFTLRRKYGHRQSPRTHNQTGSKNTQPNKRI